MMLGEIGRGRLLRRATGQGVNLAELRERMLAHVKDARFSEGCVMDLEKAMRRVLEANDKIDDVHDALMDALGDDDLEESIGYLVSAAEDDLGVTLKAADDRAVDTLLQGIADELGFSSLEQMVMAHINEVDDDLYDQVYKLEFGKDCGWW